VIVTCFLLTSVAIALGVVRFISGPTDTDRVVAVDILFSGAVAMCALAALTTRRVLFLDVAIGLILIGFVATLAWARLIETRYHKKKETET
jgi:multicomponent Na+:H+ antiporter subunit F